MHTQSSANQQAVGGAIQVESWRARRRPVRTWLRRGLRAAQQLWTAFGIALVLLLLIESGLKRLATVALSVPIETYRPGFPSESNQWLDSFGKEMAQTAGTFETTGVGWQPYCYWRSREFHGQFVNVDERGLRKSWRPPAEPRQPTGVRIYAFGGSAMWGVGNRDDFTIPSLLGRQLFERGIRAEVVNFAQMGHVTTQELIALVNELQHGNIPDLAIFLDGYNDICSGYLHKRPGVSLHEEERRREFKLLRRSSTELFALGTANLHLSRLMAGEPKPAPLDSSGAPAWHTGADLARDTVELYHRNVRIVRGLERAFGFKSLFCWQPLVFTKRQLTNFEQKEVQGRDMQLQLFRSVYERAARGYSKSGAMAGEPWSPPACFLGDVFDSPPWNSQTAFFDRCHLTEQANAAVVQRLLPAVVEALASERP